jgi:hypothetical protein
MMIVDDISIELIWTDHGIFIKIEDNNEFELA